MNRSERLARLFLFGLLLSIPAALLISRWLFPVLMSDGAGVVHARMPENGGWRPDIIRARTGELIQISLTSDDVLHGFAVGQTGWPEVEVKPGQVTRTSFTFDHPGTYTFYCTRWCGPNHWRMRGTIEVSGEGKSKDINDPPLYQQLGVDIDAPHPSKAIPQGIPSARRGEMLKVQIPDEWQHPSFIKSQRPDEYWRLLRESSLTDSLGDDQVWDLVAYAWFSTTTPQTIEQGKHLYSQNCAACHGERGQGDGVLAPSPGSHAELAQEHGLKSPPDFTDPSTMLGASPALLHGKILRGGMGTGMPNWGQIFTDEQTWALVNFLWTFQFREP